MANKNYSNYSKPKKEKPVEVVEPEVVEEAGLSTAAVVTEPAKEPETLVEVAAETVTEPVKEEPKVVTGVVVNCEKLNIRDDSSLCGEVLCIINKGEKVEINDGFSTDDFYAVVYGKDKEVSVTGYCMKKYIKINK